MEGWRNRANAHVHMSRGSDSSSHIDICVLCNKSRGCCAREILRVRKLACVSPQWEESERGGEGPGREEAGPTPVVNAADEIFWPVLRREKVDL